MLPCYKLMFSELQEQQEQQERRARRPQWKNVYSHNSQPPAGGATNAFQYEDD